MTDKEPGSGASGGSESAQVIPPATTPVTTPSTDTPKLEVKEGTMQVDGKKVVFESDLIAAKKSLEKQAEDAHSVHTTAIDKARLDLSEAQQATAAANAKVTEMESARTTGATSNEEVARVKTELEAAKGSVETLTTKSLEYRRQLIANTYQVPVEQLSEKTMEQLDSFEEALKAVNASRGGPGNYAVGGGGGSTQEMTAMDRATALLAATPARGTRNEPPNKPQ